jgi:chromosomal replication initiator protein
MQSFSTLVPLTENQVGRLALLRLAEELHAETPRLSANPVFLHGPPGCGKSHLVWALIQEVTRHGSPITAQVQSAREPIEPANCDLLVIEDIHQLPGHEAANLVQQLDERLSHQQSLVFTAVCGPAQLQLPVRLVSRLAAGLVAELQAPSVASRGLLIEAKAQQRGLRLSNDALGWLAEQCSGSVRQLEGILNQLQLVAQRSRGTLDLPAVIEQLCESPAVAPPTVDSIVQRVSGYFRIDPRRMRSASRQRSVMLPRQISMYLARRLTGLSLAEIGHYFGRRDHSTVLHACRTVQQAVESDEALSGTVQQLHAAFV